MLPLAWQKHWIIEALPSKIFIPSLFPFPPSLQCYFENPASINACFPLFHTPFFCKVSVNSTPIGILLSGNKWYETAYLMASSIIFKKRNCFYAIFIRKTNLNLQNFNIFGKYEKNRHSLETVDFFLFFFKNFLKTINMWPNLLILAKFLFLLRKEYVWG